MDQIKIGKFIAKCRKNNNLTQMLLSLTFVAAHIEMADWTRILLIIIGFVPAMIDIMVALKI